MSSCPIISIIVPVYNVEQFLGQCLESLVNQTLKEIEIICVNDGSKDNSRRILEEYRERDSRVIIIDKENEGVSVARNKGIEMAQGKYLMFVDSDDWIELTTCCNALMQIKKENADVVIWSYIREFKNQSIPKKIWNEDHLVFEKHEVQDKLHRRMIGLLGEELQEPENADALCTIWGKIYKSDIIKKNHIKFEDIREIGTYEDGMFNLSVFGFVNKAVYINEFLYHYRKFNEDSVTSRYNPKLSEQWKVLFGKMRSYIKDNKLSDEYFRALDNRIALSVLGLGLNILSSDSSTVKKISMLKEILASEMYKNAYRHLEIKRFPLHWRVFYQFAKARFAFGVFIMLRIIQTIIISR